MNPSPAESELEKQPTASDDAVSPGATSSEASPLRFTYASGSRPLDGYQIKRGVGRGGFGEVYFAVSDAGKEVALKLIRRNLDVELRGVTQCLNLKHHNLVALYDIRTDEHEDRWVVMEYVSGESLEDAIDRHPEGMPLDLAMHWFEGIASGVAYLHDHGIVHRDLKPANIFIDENVVKIGDYGLSKFISCSRRSGQTESVGTVHYMAPEIANGRYGKEIDTYALGIILYEMLTGHVPFEGESIGEVLMKHLTAEPDLNTLDEPYREIVRSAMTKDPDTRIKSVAQMLERLPNAQPNGQPQPRYTTSAEMPNPEAAAKTTSATSAPVSEEPILASIQIAWRDVEKFVTDLPLPPFAKLFLGVAAIAFLFVSGIGEFIVLPTLFTLGFTYLVYRAIRAIVLPPDAFPKTATAPVAPQANSHQPSPARVPTPDELATPIKQTKRQYTKRRRQSWQQQVNQHIAAKPMRDRATELLGSMIVAAVVSSMLALVGCAFVNETLSLELYLWMSIVATLGSWAVMVPTKLAEGHVEDRAPLRFGLLVAGALVGVMAYVAADALLLEVPVSADASVHPKDTAAANMLGIPARDSSVAQAFSTGDVPLSLPAATAYFAFLFVTLRWWKQAEYARRVRVGVWSIITCAVTAFLLSFIWWFPQPLGVVLAAIIAFATQLSSPWMPPSKRRTLAEGGA